MREPTTREKRETRKKQQSYGEVMAELEHRMVETINISSKHQELFFRALSSAGIYGFIIAISTGKREPRELSKVMEEWKDDPEELARFIERLLATIAEAAQNVELVEKLKKENEILKRELEKKESTIKNLKADNYELSTHLNGIASMLTPSQIRRFNEWMITRSIAGLRYTTISTEDIEPGFSPLPVNITVIEHDSFMEDITEIAKLKYALNKLDEIQPKEKEQPQVIRVEAPEPGKINELSSKIQDIEARVKSMDQRIETLENNMSKMGEAVHTLVDFNKDYGAAIVEISKKVNYLEKELSPLRSIKHLKKEGIYGVSSILE